MDISSSSLRARSIDDLWTLHEEVSSIVVERISTEKAKLEERLRKIESAGNAVGLNHVRRPYPKVLPKYQNPKNPGEKWSGRGKQPHWVQAQLRAGKQLKHLLIVRPLTGRRRPPSG